MRSYGGYMVVRGADPKEEKEVRNLATTRIIINMEEVMDTAAGDIRRTMETVINEEKVRDEPYLSATRNTILQSAALKSRDWGYFGGRHAMGPKDLMPCSRASGSEHRLHTVQGRC